MQLENHSARNFASFRKCCMENKPDTKSNLKKKKKKGKFYRYAMSKCYVNLQDVVLKCMSLVLGILSSM